jgi:deoxyribonuclease-4
MIIGAHVSIAGGIGHAITNAVNNGCETFQLFTKNQNQWREKVYSDPEISEFRELRKKSVYQDKPLAAHDSYLINLCANEKEKLMQSRQSFLAEIDRCTKLGIEYIIFHPGAHTGKGEDWGIRTIAESLNTVIGQTTESHVGLLIETTAGQGSTLGYSFEQIGSIVEKISDKSRIGVCIDTCHIFAAGYDLRSVESYENTLKHVQENFDLSLVKAFHLNDSKKDLGSRIDRHERIGRGCLGEGVFKRLISDPRFENIPGYLEIPGDDQAYQQDTTLLKRLREN